MPPIATSKSTVNGGTITGTGIPTASGSNIARIGDAVGSHSPFTGLHAGCQLSTGSTQTKSGGIAVSFEGCLAQCGHAIDTGSGDQHVEITS